MIKLYKFLDYCIIFSISMYFLTFLFNETTGYTFIRIAFVLGLIKILKYNTINFNWLFFKKYLIPIIVFGNILFISLIIHGLEYSSISQYERLLKSMIPFFTILFFISNKKQIYLMISFLFLGMIINDFYAFYDYFINHNYRANGINMGMLYFAGILLLQLPMLLISAINKNINHYQKIIVWFLLLITLLALYANGSRMPWLIAIIDILIVLFIHIKTLKTKLFIFIGVFICLFSIYSFNPNINTKINTLFDTNNISTRGHYFYLRDGFNLFLNNKIIGVGLDNFKNAMIESNSISKESLENLKQDLHAKINEQYVMPHAHNDIVMFLSEIGILGAIIYIYMFGSILIYTFKNWYINKDFWGLAIFLMTINILLRGLSDYNVANLGVISVYFSLFSLYLRYIYIQKPLNKKILNKKYALLLYSTIPFIILLRIISKHLFN